jgi:hypothetical protein
VNVFQNDPLFPESWEVSPVGLEEVIQNGLDHICAWPEGMGQNGLVSLPPVTTHGCFDGQKFVGFDLRQQAKADCRQGLCW